VAATLEQAMVPRVIAITVADTDVAMGSTAIPAPTTKPGHLGPPHISSADPSHGTDDPVEPI
jgi:hypothetical protein